MNYLKTVLAAGAAITQAYAAPAVDQQQQQQQQQQQEKPLNQPGAMLDDITEENAPDTLITAEMRQDAVMIVQEWSESELEKGEGYGDRLYALIVGVATDGDEEITDAESDYAANLSDLIGDYMEDKGIAPEDIDALLGEEMSFDNEVAARVHDALLDKLPQGDDAMLDDADKFVSGDDDNMMDAVYKKVMAVRQGKKVRIKKRVSGHVRLTAAQKSAVRKMQKKAFSGAAKMRRAKSMRLRRRMLGK
jgi:hypothetical protein